MVMNEIESLDESKINGFSYDDGIIFLGKIMIKIMEGYKSTEYETMTRHGIANFSRETTHKLSKVFFGEIQCPDCGYQMSVDNSYCIQLSALALKYMITNNLIVEGNINIPSLYQVCKHLISEEVALYYNAQCFSCDWKESCKSVIKGNVYRENIEKIFYRGMVIKEQRRFNYVENKQEFNTPEFSNTFKQY